MQTVRESKDRSVDGRASFLDLTPAFAGVGGFRRNTTHHIKSQSHSHTPLQSLLIREKDLDLQGHEGNETSNDGTKGDDVAAGSVEGRGGGGGDLACGLDVGGALQGAGADGPDLG